MKQASLKESQFLQGVEEVYSASREQAMDCNRVHLMEPDFNLTKLHDLHTEEYARLFYEYKTISYFKNKFKTYAS